MANKGSQSRNNKGDGFLMGKKLLIVDDQPGIRFLLSEMFKSEGYHIVTAKTGSEALDMIMNDSFDLIILDENLPVMNGLEIAKNMEKNNVTIPIIMMSGIITPLNESTKQLSSIKAVIEKPFNIQKLRERVDMILA